MWMGVGAVAGSGATVWARRRLDRLQKRMKPTHIAGGVAALVDAGARSTVDRVRSSVDSGRSAARRRELELHHELGARDLTR
jgi:hypothetical protein